MYLRYRHFSGINRKVQLKYQPRGWKRRSSSEDGELGLGGSEPEVGGCSGGVVGGGEPGRETMSRGKETMNRVRRQ